MTSISIFDLDLNFHLDLNFDIDLNFDLNFNFNLTLILTELVNFVRFDQLCSKKSILSGLVNLYQLVKWYYDIVVSRYRLKISILFSDHLSMPCQTLTGDFCQH